MKRFSDSIRDRMKDELDAATRWNSDDGLEMMVYQSKMAERRSAMVDILEPWSVLRYEWATTAVGSRRSPRAMLNSVMISPQRPWFNCDPAPALLPRWSFSIHRIPHSPHQPPPVIKIDSIAFLMAMSMATTYGRTYPSIILYTDEQWGLVVLRQSHQGVS